MIVPADTIYQIFATLFTVKILHSGYETPDEIFLHHGISIVPDKATQQFFINYKIDYRFYNNTLICFIQSNLVNPPVKVPKAPATSITGNIRVRFLVQAKNGFFEKTYVVAAGNKKIYQFSNQVNNVIGTNLFLNAPVENYSTANDYDAGTIIQNGGNLFLCLQLVLAANGIAISNTAYWKQLGATEQLVNNADLKDAAAVNADVDCFAVIDMYNNGTTNNSYNLFDASGNLFDPAPAFFIKFESKF